MSDIESRTSTNGESIMTALIPMFGYVLRTPETGMAPAEKVMIADLSNEAIPECRMMKNIRYHIHEILFIDVVPFAVNCVMHS